jgi:2-dehydro-3-deoxyphosphogluconate aldolase/(4S)-4-hydroxy-2-oxoglutarate aldolase
MPVSALPLFARCRIMPIVTIEDVGVAAPLAETLLAAGISAAEVTLRTPAALSAITAMKRAAPGLTIGAGTVKSAADVQAARNAGAEFFVSPAATPALLSALAASGLPALPGVATLSEAMAARAMGFDVLKLFPAEPIGGLSLLQAWAGPCPEIVFCPTGGIDAEKAKAYLALKTVAGIGGSWVAAADLLRARNFAEIAARAAAACRIAAP